MNEQNAQPEEQKPMTFIGKGTALLFACGAALLVACAAGCEREKSEDPIRVQIHYINGGLAALRVANEIQGGIITPAEAGIKLDEARTNYLRSLQ